MKYIDIHAHAYRKPVPFVTLFCTAEELIARYDRFGIEAGAVLPVVNSEIYFPQANEDILDMVEAHSDRLFAFCNIDPRALINRADAQLDQVLEYYKKLGCKGVGEIMPNLHIMDERVQNLFACAEKVGLPVTTDGSDRVGGDFGLCDEPGIPGLEHTLQRFPALKFIAHGPIFWNEIVAGGVCRGARKAVFGTDGLQHGTPAFAPELTGSGMAQELLRAFPNLYGELSDACGILKYDEDFAVDFLVEFQDKLMFGTDCCNNTCDANFEIKLWFDHLHESGKLPTDAWKKICRNNAIEFFDLPFVKA